MTSGTFEGSCQCGDVHYRLRGEPINCFACHCTQCQKQSASAFGLALWLSDFVVEELVGELGSWTRDTPSGQALTGEFCVRCGTRLFHRQSRNPGVISIKPGTLADTRELDPVAHIWISEAQSWIRIPEDSLSYDGNPPDFGEMMQAFRERRARHG